MKNEEVLARIKKLEYGHSAGSSEERDCCVYCGMQRKLGHRSDCLRNEILATLEVLCGS
jgi:hypothetical protein